jgi:glycosyltransferase involved in cell wall biosynthesis
LKIYINATGPDGVSGYFTYITNLVRKLSLIDNSNIYYVYCNGEINNALKSLEGNIQVLNVLPYFRLNIIRFLWMQLFLPIILFSQKADILFSPLNASPFILKYFRIKSILVIHSNLPWTNSQYLPYGQIKSFILKKLKEISLKSSNMIICVSQTARDELLQYTNVDPKMVNAIHLGFDERVEQTSISNLNKYFLYVANSALHHNHLNLLIGFNLFIQNTHYDYHLYLVMDKVDKNHYYKILDKIKELNISDYVKIISPLDRQELYKLYNGAKLYIFPSLAETFGMTTLEAMAHGTPVICSNISAMPEINGNAALYFNPIEPIEISEKIKLLIDNDDLYNKQIIKGYKRVRNFTWQKTAKKTIDVFEQFSNK